MDPDSETLSDKETFQQQALEIQQPGEHFDYSAVPQSGEEFLTRMLYERKLCPSVVVRRPKTAQKEEPVTCLPPDKGDLSPQDVPENFFTTIEWKAEQVKQFEETQRKMARLRKQLVEENYDNSLEPPLIKDSENWMKFCKENPPLLRTLLRLNQPSLEQLLDMISEWLQERSGTITPEEDLPRPSSSSSAAALAGISSLNIFDLTNSEQWLGAWLYAVLASLHMPLEPDVHSTLRDIVRHCIRLRGRLLPHELNKATPFNLFIHLIAKVFHQLDFAGFV